MKIRGVDDRRGKYRPTNGVEYEYNWSIFNQYRIVGEFIMEVICFFITIFLFCIFIDVYTDYINNKK